MKTKWIMLGLLSAAALLASGCANFGYYDPDNGGYTYYESYGAGMGQTYHYGPSPSMTTWKDYYGGGSSGGIDTIDWNNRIGDK